MTRRFTVAVAATAALGIAAGGIASAGAGAAAKKNEIQIVGGTIFKAGKFIKDNQRFKPLDASVKSGATVTVRNKAKSPEPHTISFVEKRYLPKSFESAVDEKLIEAHQVDVVDDGVAVPDGGTLEVDKGFTPDVAGDSAFIAPGQKTFSFKVTAKKGSNLFYYCAVHPWMQGKITVK